MALLRRNVAACLTCYQSFFVFLLLAVVLAFFFFFFSFYFRQILINEIWREKNTNNHCNRIILSKMIKELMIFERIRLFSDSYKDFKINWKGQTNKWKNNKGNKRRKKIKKYVRSTGGLRVECSPATRAIRVRVSASAKLFLFFLFFHYHTFSSFFIFPPHSIKIHLDAPTFSSFSSSFF